MQLACKWPMHSMLMNHSKVTCPGCGSQIVVDPVSMEQLEDEHQDRMDVIDDIVYAVVGPIFLAAIAFAAVFVIISSNH